MSVSGTGKAISPRQRRAKLKGETTVEVEKNNQGSNLNTNKIEQDTDGSVQENSGKLVISGVRPIANSDLEIAETINEAGLRPISTSHLQVVETINEAGLRPISANTFQIVDSISSSGIRPISSSSLVVSESYSVFGNRPVASNNIDDSTNLMGFLD
jgi:hypothetical protein